MSIFATNLQSFGRLFSSYTETGDPYRIALYAQASVLNSVLSGQIIFYRRPITAANTKLKLN